MMKAFLNKHIVKIFISIFAIDTLLISLMFFIGSSHFEYIAGTLLAFTLSIQILFAFTILFLLLLTRVIHEKKAVRASIVYILLNIVIIICCLYLAGSSV